MSEKHSKISLIVTSHNQLKYSKIMYESLKKYTHYPYELVWVDSDSTDGTRDWLKSDVHKNTVSVFVPSMGIGEAMNIGFSHCDKNSEYIGDLDNDIILTERWLTRLINHMENDKKIASCQPLWQRNMDRLNWLQQLQLRLERQTINRRIKHLGRDQLRVAIHSISQKIKDKKDVKNKWWVNGSHTIYRRSALEEVGLWNPALWMGEDRDIGIRLSNAGWRNVIALNTCVYHFQGKTTDAIEKSDPEWQQHRMESRLLLREMYGTRIRPQWDRSRKKSQTLSRIFFLGVHAPRHRNIGDFAQTYAIRKWFTDYFPEQQVFEFSKSQVVSSLNSIKSKANREDLIFINSGGDMGDRYAKWELARRRIVQTFHKNRVVSLPQTIYYSDTDHGRSVLRKSADVYNSHRRLLIMARDPVSYKNALKHFKLCEVMLFPDFALYLKVPESNVERKGCLLCLRGDRESKLDTSDKAVIRRLIPMEVTEFDTILEYDITQDKREKAFKETIKVFQSHEVVVTDRFHGMIFSYIARTPCVVLLTPDHKISSGIEWFNEVKQIKLTSPSQVSSTLEQVTSEKEPYLRIDWKDKYFRELKNKLGL